MSDSSVTTKQYLRNKKQFLLNENDSFCHYTVLKKIGQGGMSVVYKAYDKRLGRIVALKIMSSNFQNEQSLLREASTMAKVDHPNIIRIYDIGVEPCFYFAMEYIEGLTLTEWIPQNSDSETKKLLKILIQLVEAIEEIHKHNIIHRDIKPSNIIITKERKVKLMDFGVAKVSKKSMAKMNNQLTPVGSPGYMAPEQISGNASHKSDIYGFGATLYQIICGRPPFYGGKSINIMFEVLSKDPVVPHILNPYVSRELEAICLKCMQKLPEKRYASIKQLMRDLKNLQLGHTIIAKRYTQWEAAKKFILRNKFVIFCCVLALCFGILFCIWQHYLIQQLETQRKKSAMLLKELEEEKEITAQLMNAAISSLEYGFSNNRILQKDEDFLDPVRQIFVKLKLKKQVEEKLKHDKDSQYSRLYSIAFGLSKDEVDIQKGLENAENMIKKNPEEANSYIVKANLYFEQKQYENALSLFQKVLLLEPENLVIILGIANCYKNLGNNGEALKHYSKVISIDNRFADAYYNRAILWKKLNEIGKAIDDYTKVIEIDNTYAFAYNNRGFLWMLKQDWPKALQDFNAALIIDNNYWEARANRGNVYANMGRYQEAINDYTFVLEEKPESLSIYQKRAYIYEIQKNYLKAIEDYKKIVSLQKDIFEPYLKLASIYLQQKEFKNALDVLESFPEPQKLSAMDFYLKGQIQHKVGNFGAAIQSYEKAIKLKHPQSKKIGALIKKLRKK